MVGLADLVLTCSEMAVTARRTLAKVKSSAINPRQPEVPNLMGEGAKVGEALIFSPQLFRQKAWNTVGSVALSRLGEKGLGVRDRKQELVQSEQRAASRRKTRRRL